MKLQFTLCERMISLVPAGFHSQVYKQGSWLMPFCLMLFTHFQVVQETQKPRGIPPSLVIQPCFSVTPVTPLTSIFHVTLPFSLWCPFIHPWRGYHTHVLTSGSPCCLAHFQSPQILHRKSCSHQLQSKPWFWSLNLLITTIKSFCSFVLLKKNSCEVWVHWIPHLSKSNRW